MCVLCTPVCVRVRERDREREARSCLCSRDFFPPYLSRLKYVLGARRGSWGRNSASSPKIYGRHKVILLVMSLDMHIEERKKIMPLKGLGVCGNEELQIVSNYKTCANI